MIHVVNIMQPGESETVYYVPSHMFCFCVFGLFLKFLPVLHLPWAGKFILEIHRQYVFIMIVMRTISTVLIIR